MTIETLLENKQTLIIAEVGSNHAGDPGLAKESIAAAKEAGADVVKFQIYKAEQLVDNKMPVLKYIEQSHSTQRERFKSLQLTEAVFEDLALKTADAGLEFMVTPFYEDAVAFLDPFVPAFKVASGDLTNLRLLRACIETGKPLILSTGLSTLEEIDWAVSHVPAEQLHLLHCVGAYPTPDPQVNLGAIPFLAERYDQVIGYSDHSEGITACIAAVTLGANIIEKHFLPSDDRQVADKALSAGVNQFRQMVSEIRRVELMRGIKEKKIQVDEAYFCKTLRRSIYSTVNIPKGTILTPDMLMPLRPWSSDACSPMDIDSLEGKCVNREIEAGTPVFSKDIG